MGKVLFCDAEIRRSPPASEEEPMSAVAVADTTTVTRPASVRPAHVSRLRPTPAPPSTSAPAAGLAAAGPVTDVPVTITISIGGGSVAGRDRVLAALRGLVMAAGPDVAVALAPPSGPQPWSALLSSEPLSARPASFRSAPFGPASFRPASWPAGHPVDGVSLDPRPRTAARDGWPLRLSRLEYDLLLFLARHPRQVFSRSQLLAQVWGHTHTTTRTVDVHVSRIRAKLGDQDIITTVYGLGYRLSDDAEVTVVDDGSRGRPLGRRLISGAVVGE
jgi:DNA-binding winged helix-turn-helix (wHTH) protein